MSYILHIIFTTYNRHNTSDPRDNAYIAQTYPFSDAVPNVMRELHLMVTRFFLFAARNPLLGSRGESVCKATKKAFSTVASTLKKELQVDGENTPLSKACQISIDAATFAQASDTLWIIMVICTHLYINFHSFTYNIYTCIYV